MPSTPFGFIPLLLQLQLSGRRLAPRPHCLLALAGGACPFKRRLGGVQGAQIVLVSVMRYALGSSRLFSAFTFKGTGSASKWSRAGPVARGKGVGHPGQRGLQAEPPVKGARVMDTAGWEPCTRLASGCVLPSVLLIRAHGRWACRERVGDTGAGGGRRAGRPLLAPDLILFAACVFKCTVCTGWAGSFSPPSLHTRAWSWGILPPMYILSPVQACPCPTLPAWCTFSALTQARRCLSRPLPGAGRKGVERRDGGRALAQLRAGPGFQARVCLQLVQVRCIG